jgi:hypothetical protein
VAGSCEHGNEPSGSIKCREFLDWLSVLLAFQEGLCSMELKLWYVTCIIHKVHYILSVIPHLIHQVQLPTQLH